MLALVEFKRLAAEPGDASPITDTCDATWLEEEGPTNADCWLSKAFSRSIFRSKSKPSGSSPSAVEKIPLLNRFLGSSSSTQSRTRFERLLLPGDGRIMGCPSWRMT